MSLPELSKLLSARWRSIEPSERAVHDAAAVSDVKRYISECEALGIDPGKAARLASGPLPALSALGFFKAQSEATIGITLSGGGDDGAELPDEVAALLRQGWADLAYDERDELTDLGVADTERFDEDIATVQAAAAKRRRAIADKAATAAATNTMATTSASTAASASVAEASRSSTLAIAEAEAEDAPAPTSANGAARAKGAGGRRSSSAAGAKRQRK
jgi:hypothetical protein